MTATTTRPRRITPVDHDPEAITWARKAKRWTKSRLAHELGISVSLMAEIEKGTRNATPEKLHRLAEVLNCPVSMLERKRIAS